MTKINTEFLSKIFLMGTGMATGAYDLLIINFTMLVLAELYSLSSWESSLVATASLVGTFSGQVIFGPLGDNIGRKKSSLITCSILFIGAFGSGALTYSVGSSVTALYVILASWRFLLGVGIGGEYPVTAIFTGENSNGSIKRGTAIAGMFSSQGIGNVIAAISFFLLLLSFPEHLEYVWRFALLLGCIPPLFIIIPRIRMKETESFLRETSKKERGDVSFKKTISEQWKKLVGTAGCWFLFDIVFYGNSLFSGPILEAVGISDEEGWLGITYNVAFNVVISFIALPGYWCGTFLIDKVGRKPLQMVGLATMAALYITIGIFYDSISQNTSLFILFYGLSYFFANAGPNTTTFVIPTEIYPSSIRSTCHGLSAASGKFGAIIGAFFISPLLNATSPPVIFILCGIISVLACILTFFFIVESKDISLEDLDEAEEEIIPTKLTVPEIN